MKAILEFSLPEDSAALNVASHAHDWARVVLDMDEQLRRWGKHGLPEGLAERSNPLEVLQFVRDRLRATVLANGVSLEDLE